MGVVAGYGGFRKRARALGAKIVSPKPLLFPGSPPGGGKVDNQGAELRGCCHGADAVDFRCAYVAGGGTAGAR